MNGGEKILKDGFTRAIFSGKGDTHRVGGIKYGVPDKTLKYIVI